VKSELTGVESAYEIPDVLWNRIIYCYCATMLQHNKPGATDEYWWLFSNVSTTYDIEPSLQE